MIAPGTTAASVHSVHTDVKRQAWSKIEDGLLNNAMQTCGSKDWASIATHLPGRAPIECMQHWQQQGLDPTTVNGYWTEEEDAKLRKIKTTNPAMPWFVNQ